MLRIICFLLPFSMMAQWSFIDDFSDSAWQTNGWQGDTMAFRFINPGIQLQDSMAGSSQICLPLPALAFARWDLHGKLDFNPSSSNFLEWTLLQDHQDPDSTHFSYYLKLGGNAQDQIQFYRRDTGTEQLIWVSPPDFLNQASNHFHLSLRRDSSDQWEIYADTGQFVQWTWRGSIRDTNHHFCAATAIRCQYTKTRSTKFFIDSIRLSADTVQGDAPVLLSQTLKNDSTLQLRFDKKLKAPNAPHFQISPGLGVYRWNWRPQNPALFEVIFASLPQANLNYQLKIQGLFSRFNQSFEDTLYFMRRQLNPNDLVITEIMADPSPKVDLSPYSFPEVEYLELFNASSLPANLKGFQLQIGTRMYSLSEVVLNPNEYLILCAENSREFWPPSFHTLGLEWSTSALSNEGNQIRIYDASKRLISEVVYTKSWYRDPLKSEGGWSLERIDPYTPCANTYNWKESESSSGGSPGQKNTVEAPYSDTVVAMLQRWELEQASVLRLHFNRSLNTSDSAWQIDPPLAYDSLIWSGASQELSFYFVEDLVVGAVHSLSLNDSLIDCAGQRQPFTTFNFGIPLSAIPGDLRISEVLFNPFPEGEDFIEIVNLGSSFVDLASLRIGLWDPESMLSLSADVISEKHQILGPGEVAVLANKLEDLTAFYPFNTGQFVAVGTMPSMPDKGAALQLLNADLMPIDRVVFTEEAHSPLVPQAEGRSLYRLDFTKDALNDSYWQSTSQTRDFATPGWIPVDSHSSGAQSTWAVSPDYFSPNGDAYRESLNLYFQLPSEAWLQAYIVDAYGKKRFTLESGDYYPSEGNFVWKGQTEEGALCEAGIYIAYLEYRTADGKMERKRCSFVLSL